MALGAALLQRRPGALERPGALRLHRVHPRRIGEAAGRHRALQRLRAALAKAAAHLHHQVIERRPAGIEHLAHQRLAAVDGQAVLVCPGSRRAAPRPPAPRRKWRTQVALFARRSRGQATTWAPSWCSRASTAGSASGGTNTCSARRARASTSGGQGRIAAAGDGQRRLGGRLGGRGVDHLQDQQDAHQVPGLVRAGDMAGLVLHPQVRPSCCPSAAEGP